MRKHQEVKQKIPSGIWGLHSYCTVLYSCLFTIPSGIWGLHSYCTVLYSCLFTIFITAVSY